MKKTKEILLGEKLTLEDLAFFQLGEANLVLSKKVSDRTQKSFFNLEKISKENVIYGINTGFGPMARTFIAKNRQIDLQYNLIRSHATSLGRNLEVEQVRMIMLLRLHSLSLGYSGVSKDVVNSLKNFLERGITPVIKEHGSVGASGDLVQLAHIALSLIGEGEVFYKGKIVEAKLALKSEKLKPLDLKGRDGLALINGTSAMTGIAVLNFLKAKNLVENSILSSALLFEIANTEEGFFSEVVYKLRNHRGQKSVIEKLRKILKDSGRIKSVKPKKVKDFDNRGETSEMKEVLQEIYSLRCVPQILGPILDTLDNAQGVIETEINSVTDNPLIVESKVVHAGNFHGDYISLEMDKLRIAITKLSILLERQLNFLMNPNLNGKLPPFLNSGVLGLNLGLQGLQFVATSTVAENQTLSTPISIHSIPNNNDNQDVVSMGMNSALLTGKTIDNSFEVLAILMTALSYAVNILGIKKELSSATGDFLDLIIKRVSYSKEDRVLSGVGNLARDLKNSYPQGRK